MPSPWSDEIVTGAGDGSHRLAYALPGVHYLVAQGTTHEGTWRVIATKMADDDRGTLIEYGGDVFGHWFGYGFGRWPAGQPVQWETWRGTTAPRVSLVLGAVGPDARSVRVSLEDGTQRVTEAVATPVSQDMRFFAVAIPASSKAVEVHGVTAGGAPAAPPPGLPWPSNCSSDVPCPTRAPEEPQSGGS